ncbi:methyltransferase [Desulfurivibrio dismutans]|uniref:methyltransferase n=1 Tax=Desulfurivibrio dismutans TaxID=1398908 RepID=UPI0023DB019B|nr:methyltransferase [Desulfurivibrio alkaliphilus]MDF1614971.1 methyltransferase [Desulfurivibrio alkaliphilus]
MSESTAISPQKILSLAGGYWQPCALHCGVKLDVFTQLADKRLPATEVADRLNASLRGVEMLLNALTAMELLDKNDKGFLATEEARVLLDRKSSKYVGHMVMHHHHLVDGWSQLDQAVVTGRAVTTRSHGEERERESFIMGMHNLSMSIAHRLAAQIDLTVRKQLLDLGGGPGVHAVHFCLANPGLRATVLDRHTTEPFARRTAEEAGVADRVSFVGGDFLVDPLPVDHDAAWLSHIIHSCSPEECRHLITRTVAALKPGGLIMIHDFFLDQTHAAPLFAALFSLNMLIGNEGRSYGEDEVRQTLNDCGVTKVSRLDFTGPNQSGVLMGTLPE